MLCSHKIHNTIKFQCDSCQEIYNNYRCSICDYTFCSLCRIRGLGPCDLCFKIGHSTDNCPDYLTPGQKSTILFGWQKDPNCYLRNLPREILKEIFQRLKNTRPFQDLIEILDKHSVRGLFEKSYLTVMGFELLVMNHREKIDWTGMDIFKKQGFVIVPLKSYDLLPNEKKVIKSYWLRISRSQF